MRLMLILLSFVLVVNTGFLGLAEEQIPSTANSFISCSTFSAKADGEQSCSITVAVHDAAGMPVAGRDVLLISDRGDIDQISPEMARLDDQGRATFTVRSTAPGQATLSARCGEAVINKGISNRGLVALLTFDGTSPAARVRDLSGLGNHGRLSGDPQFVKGRSGDAISLNGVDQYVEIPDSPSMSGKYGNQIETWINTGERAKDVVQVVAQKSHGFGGDYSLTLQGQRIAYQYRSSQRENKQKEEALSDSDAMTPHKWTQLVGFWEGSNVTEAVRDHGYVRAYACEEIFEVAPRAQQLEGIWNGRHQTQPFSIGRSGDGTQYYQGLIDEFRVYDRALYDEEMRRNHAGVATVSFGLAAPVSFAADAKSLPECVILSWLCDDRNATSFHIYRSASPEVRLSQDNLLKVVPHDRDHFRDYEVDFDRTYYYRIVSDSFENSSESSPEVSARPFQASNDERWYVGDGHLHTFTHDIDVEDFDPEGTLAFAKKAGWDFALITEHNSLGSFFRSEDQAAANFIVFGNGQEISDGGNHRTGAFLTHFIPTSDSDIREQNEAALLMGGEVGPNHSPYNKGPQNITLFETVNDKKWFPLQAWDEQYLKQGIHVAAKGGSDAHGRFSVKRGYRWLVWSDRLSHRALRNAIHSGRTISVDGDGLQCMLKVNGTMIGDTVRVARGNHLTVEMSADAKLGNVSEVKLIRFGETVQTWTPAEPAWKFTFDDGEFSGVPTYYRLEVKSDGKERRAVTSAVFVQPEPVN